MKIHGYRASFTPAGSLFIVMLSLLAACVSGCSPKKEGKAEGADTDSVASITHYARLLRMYDDGIPGCVRVDVVNPWDTTAMLAQYLLVSDAGAPSDCVAPGYRRLQVPLSRSLVYSGVHAGLLAELGAADAVAGVADGGYFTTEPYVSRIKGGEIIDVGSSQSPSQELVVALKPDAVLASPFENAGYGIIDRLGIPVIECADYMEDTPLGRAEWMRFFGRLYGRGAEADSIFSRVRDSYDRIAADVSGKENKPLVLTEMLTDGYWFVPGGKSYMARMIQDAGGRYPWSTDRSRGSLQLDYSSVYARAADADVWLIRSFGHDLTLDDIQSVYLLNGQFKAFKQNNVWVANTAEVPLYEEFPFHPDMLLQEYASIFHSAASGASLRYYKRAL